MKMAAVKRIATDDMDDWIACPACDLLHRAPQVPKSHTARCTRCGAVLYQFRAEGVDAALALALTGLVLFVLSNAFPLLTFEMEGRIQENTLISGVAEFWQAGFFGLSALVFATSVLLPLLSLLSIVFVMAPLRLGTRPWWAAKAFRLAMALRPWAMMEVFMLGMFVAIVKLTDIANVVPGTALYCFAGLIVITAAAAWRLDARQVWREMEALG